MKHCFLIIFSLLVMSSTANGLELRRVHVEWNYDASVTDFTGFRLYHDGNPTGCEIKDTSARQMDCDLMLGDGENSFTMKAFRTITNPTSEVTSPPSTQVTVSVPNIVLPGDVNDSGTVDLSDLYLVQEILTGKTPNQPVYIEADINGDGKIGTAEAQYILQKISGMR